MRLWLVALVITVGSTAVGGLSRPTAADATPLPEVTATASGSAHTCAIVDGATVRCWGDNQSGQLGTGTTTPQGAPVEVVAVAPGTGALRTVTQVSAGRAHTCAVVGRDGVACWGNNSSGQLGDGSTSVRSTPVMVLDPAGGPSLAGAKSVVAGLHHSCALLSSSRVACWGNNTFGQLGDGTTTSSARAVIAVDDEGAPLSSIRQITSGAFHTCALTSSGSVHCWGNDFLGQRGDDVDLERISQLAAGAFHTCALLADDSVRCWGANTSAQLGNGTTTSSRTPVAVQAPGGRGQLGDVEELTAGFRHTCARTDDGAVHCWGDNMAGQLGQGSTREIRTVVTVVGPTGDGALASIERVAASGNHTCAVDEDGRASCWGANDAGQLGRPARVGTVPLVVPHELTEVKGVTGWPQPQLRAPHQRSGELLGRQRCGSARRQHH
ncbi:MAG: hypothetical protein AAF467_11410 [Actinomycetota bacterium]